MQQDRLRTALSELLGTAHVQVQAGTLVALPGNETEVSAVLSFASQHQLGVVPQGSGSQANLGGQLQKKDFILSLERMSGVIEHSAADLTVTVFAGTSLQTLQQYLKTAGQWLAIDPAVCNTATIGGILATNASGPKRVLYGSLRDQVIGLRVVYPDGNVIKTGGKVVKNVAGYDMNKLFIGSLGTLGVITEATFKLRPLPKYQQLALIEITRVDDIQQIRQSILNSELIPSSLELVSPGIATSLGIGNSHVLLVGCDEGRAAAAYQGQRLREIAGNHSVAFVKEEQVDRLWQDYQSELTFANPQRIGVKVSLLPTQIHPFLLHANRLAQQEPFYIEYSAGLGTGIIRLSIEQHHQNFTAISAYLANLRGWTERQNGALVIETAPNEIKDNISVWGNVRSDFFLLRRIKQTIDPGSVLNAGRFVGGL